ncbi:MAG: 2-oxoacid:ferredoxin oxidoreductase subunit gamma [Chloroflexota bacterium]|nr:MAG: 2-oxoacid:ferredoxin oxidoreductase subunit gamma [Chloroflexota bacterium]
MGEPLELILAGRGGQGIMTAAEVLGWAVTLSGRAAACLMEYGAEMRGGYIRAFMAVDDHEVTSQIVEHPHAILCMHEKEWEFFRETPRPGGCVVVNTSTIRNLETRPDIRVIEVPCHRLAMELGSERVVSMVALGAVIGATDIVTLEQLGEGLKKILPERHHRLIPLNLEALKTGMQVAKSALSVLGQEGGVH